MLRSAVVTGPVPKCTDGSLVDRRDIAGLLVATRIFVGPELFFVHSNMFLHTADQSECIFLTDLGLTQSTTNVGSLSLCHCKFLLCAFEFLLAHCKLSLAYLELPLQVFEACLA